MTYSIAKFHFVDVNEQPIWEKSTVFEQRFFFTYDTLDGVHHTNMILLGLDGPPIVCLCSFYIISPIELPLPLVHSYDNSGRSLQNDCLDHIWHFGMVQNLSARQVGRIFSDIQGRRSLVGCLVDIWQISFFIRLESDHCLPLSMTESLTPVWWTWLLWRMVTQVLVDDLTREMLV